MQFRAKALSAANTVVMCSVDAVDPEEARVQLGRQGLRVLTLSSRRRSFKGARSRVPLVSFSQELVSLLDAGLSLVESIDTLAEKESVQAVKRTIDAVRQRLREGQTLSSSLAEQSESFPQLYVASIRASERTGAISQALLRYIAYQKQIDHLRKSLVNAAIYPTVLVVLGLLVTLFLMGYVVPRFSIIYQDLGEQLPVASRWLMEWGQLLQTHAMGASLGIMSLLGAAVWGLTRPAVRAFASRAIARVPAIGAQLHLYQLARLYRTLGMLLKGGTPMVNACQMSSGLLNSALRPDLAAATQAIREGRSIVQAFEGARLTTPVAARMLRVGERSGNMGEMMERIAAFYDEELSRRLEVLVRLIEPLLMTAIGLIIGIVVVLMYLPIFELASSIR